jgi:hypothetical protein
MIASTLASVSSTWQAGRYAYRTGKAALNMLMRCAGAWYEIREIILVSQSLRRIPESGFANLDHGHASGGRFHETQRIWLRHEL